MAAALTFTAALPAQTTPRRVIEVTLSEYKYEPNQIRFHEGESVVLKLKNIGPRLAHNMSSRYWLDIPLTIRGDARQGISEDRKWVALDVGREVEVEFIAKGRGSYAVICSIFDHAVQGHTGAFFVLPPASP
ncbi:MAG: cupredoxin domain-containing protein [Armatimonadetes bacterium]|nr:cupredoxin domain-containing protein [Armatimonadota bacterium]